MKKTLLSFIISSVIGLNALYAQCVINTSYTQPGNYPNCSTGLPPDTVGQAYSTVLQMRILTDTVFGGYSATVDSIVLTSVKGLPGGFSYACNPSSNHFPGGSNACVQVSGAPPTSGMVGNYPIKIYITIYGKLSGIIPASVPDSITCYSISIEPAATGIPELSNSKFDLSQNFPDPATNLTTIYYSVPASAPLDFKLYNLLGKIVYQKSFFAERGTGGITIDAKDYGRGIYMYNLSNGKTTLTRRMVITDN